MKRRNIIESVVKMSSFSRLSQRVVRKSQRVACNVLITVIFVAVRVWVSREMVYWSSLPRRLHKANNLSLSLSLSIGPPSIFLRLFSSVFSLWRIDRRRSLHWNESSASLHALHWMNLWLLTTGMSLSFSVLLAEGFAGWNPPSALSFSCRFCGQRVSLDETLLAALSLCLPFRGFHWSKPFAKNLYHAGFAGRGFPWMKASADSLFPCGFHQSKP